MQKILVLAAIPDRLRLDQEIRSIEEAIKRAVKRDLFEIKIRTAVRPQDIRRAIAEEKPQIVHFCGHGMEDGSLVLEDDGGNHKPVSPTGLAALFKLHTDYVKCVLLNACYSALPAEAISKHINYVIGMNQPIEDRAAIVFAQGFYDGLGYDNINNLDVIQRAFDEGIVAIQLENLLQGAMPSLWKLGIAHPQEAIKREQEAQRIQRQKEQLEYENNLRSDLLILCPHCKLKSPDTNNFCQKCGTSLIDLDNQRRQAELKKQKKGKSSPLISNSDDDLRSDRAIDYTRLRDLLAAGNWEEADEETLSVMLKASGREEKGWLNSKSIENFPCTDLRTIDKLWVKYSSERFGFSVQKRIWESFGRNYNQFGKHVGWTKKESMYEWIAYKEITFDTSAPRGHLPRSPRRLGTNWQIWLMDVFGTHSWCHPRIFSRIQTCKL